MSDYIDTTFEFEGNNIPLRIFTGVVVDTETRSDTHVYGGGSYTSGNQVHVSSVRSRVEVTKDVWLRYASGKEERFQFGDLAIRPGHILQISYFTANFGKTRATKSVRHIISNASTDIYWDRPSYPKGGLYNSTSTSTDGRSVVIQKNGNGLTQLIIICLSPVLGLISFAVIIALLGINIDSNRGEVNNGLVFGAFIVLTVAFFYILKMLLWVPSIDKSKPFIDKLEQAFWDAKTQRAEAVEQLKASLAGTATSEIATVSGVPQ